MKTTDAHGKDLTAARADLARVADRVGAARGERVATLCKLWYSPRRFGYIVRFHMPGDLASFTDEHQTRVEPVEQHVYA
jgi:hypothetical protein